MTTRVAPEAMLGELEGLRALARSLVHGDAEADDLLQDTAIAAITHPPAEDRPARPWLATVLRNRWRMDRRAASRRRLREHLVAETADVVDMRGAEASIDRARVLERLSRALVALDEPFRTVVIRRYLDGQSAVEIARALGIPAGTVRWRLKAALDRLRAALDDQAPRWQRALVPFAVSKGAVAVKAKTSLLWILVVLLALGGVVIAIAVGRGEQPAEPVVAAGGRTVEALRKPVTPPRTGEVAPPPVVDPLPGQGRAALERTPGPGAVSGRVINWSTGEGVAGAELTFTGDAGATTVRTREDGAFELAPGVQGHFVLTTVSAPGFLPYAPELDHSGVHVALEKERAVRGLTVFLFPAVDYKGKVVDARGTPVPGARVRLLGTPTGEQSIEKLPTEWTSDKDGKFVFHAADDAVLEAVRGSQRGWSRLDGNVAITKHLVITLGDAPARDLAIRGRTVDTTGAPIPGVLLRAIPEDAPGQGRGSTRAVMFATSGADGAFVIEDLDREPYTVTAEDEARATWHQANVKAGGAPLTATLDAGQPLAGTVVSATGEVVPAYTLLVLRKTSIVREVMLARSIVEANGRFAVRVPAGDYELLASASGWAPSAPVAVPAGTTDVKLVVSAGATLRGIVVDKASGTPLPRARIMREGPGGGSSALPANAGTVTREDGTFELTGLPPGPVAITIGGHGYHPRVEAGMTAIDGGVLGPLTIGLTKLAPGEQPSLELVGIGVQLAADGDALRVDLVMPESGAAAAGIVVGDRLTSVDGVPVTTLGIDGAIARIRGTAGTKLTVGVRRGEETLQLVVERKKMRA